MADIFISYAHDDQRKIEQLAHALEANGLTVWWDRHIEAGANFSRNIEQELQNARAVIVAWSVASEASTWVKDEATLALEQEKLLPIQLDTSPPPLGFRQFQAIDLSKWKGEASEPAFQNVLTALQRRLGGTVTPSAPASPAASAAAETRTKLTPLHLGALAAAALLLLSLAIAFWPSEQEILTEEVATTEPAVLPKDVVSLAVIPFINLSPDPEGEYFADGLSEELLNWLANVQDLRVPGRTSSFVYKNKTEDLRQIGDDLNVSYLLEGSVREAGGKLRITAQLIDVESGFHIWSKTYDRTLDDIFTIQEDIAETVTRELLGALPNGGVVNPGETGKVDARAHKLYLEGRAYWSVRNRDRAIEKFHEAISIDPNHALAQAYLAIIISQALSADLSIPLDGLGPKEVIDQALSKAVALQPESADVLFAQGWVTEMGTAMTFDPAIKRARDEEAIIYYERAIRAYPRHVEALYAEARLSFTFETANQASRTACQENLDRFRAILTIDPGHIATRTIVMNCYWTLGERAKYNQALEEIFKSGADVHPAFGLTQARKSGAMTMAIRFVFRNWTNPTPTDSINPFRIALLADLGASQAALDLSRYQDFSIYQTDREIWHHYTTAILADNQEGQLERITELARSVEPPSIWGQILIQAQIAHGQYEAAEISLRKFFPEKVAAPETAMAIEDTNDGIGDYAAYYLALIYEKTGREEDARKIWTRARELEGEIVEQGWRKTLNLAVIEAHLGNREAAIAHFQKAYDQGFRFLYSFECAMCIDPSLVDQTVYFEPLKGDRDFLAIIEQIRKDNADLLESLDAEYHMLEKIGALKAETP